MTASDHAVHALHVAEPDTPVLRVPGFLAEFQRRVQAERDAGKDADATDDV